MSSVDQWALIVGGLLPLVLSIIMQRHWSDAARSFVAFLACIVAGLGTVYFAGTLNVDWNNSKTISSACLLVGVTAWTTYEHFYKQTGISPKIEAATYLPHVGIIPEPPTDPTANG